MKTISKLLAYFLISFFFYACSSSENNSENLAPIIEAIKTSNVTHLETLLNEDNVNAYDSTGMTMLSLAVRTKNIETVNLLLEKKANPDLQNKNELKSTPLMECSNINQVAIAELLIANNADINLKDKNGDPVIHWSAYYGQEKLTNLLLENKARTDIKSIHSKGVIQVALKEWKTDIVDLLLKNGVNTHNVFKNDLPIIEAIKKNNTKFIKQNLTDKKANLVDGAGTPILCIAAEMGRLEIVKTLIKKGADINKINEVGHTALNRAVYFKKNNVAKFLIQKGADINKTDKRFKLTPLVAAIRNNNNEMGKLLIEKGADVNQQDGINEFSPVMWAALYQNKNLLKELLIKNPDLTLKSKYDTDVFSMTQNKEIQNILGQYKK